MVMSLVQIFRDFVVDGVPSSGRNRPKKSEVRSWGSWVESVISAFLSVGGKVYDTRASLYADLSHESNAMAWVIGDPTAAYNGIYRKNGAATTGSWMRLGDLPYSFIIATDSGAGTPNAIQATSSIPISGSALVIMNVLDATTASPVTVSFNGGSVLTIKTNTGNDIAPGGLVAGMQLVGVVSGSVFRLVSDQVSSAIVAHAEDAAERSKAAAAEAANYAALALNNWVVDGPFVGTGALANYPLTVDPGSPNNMYVIVDGISQLVTDGAYDLVYVSGSPYVRINVPTDIPFEVRLSNSIAVGTPSDGSISTPKIVNKAVTYSKIQDVSETDKILGRSSFGTGSVEEIPCTAAGRSLIAAESPADQRAAIQIDVGFSAHKNSVDQTGLSSDTYAKVTFGTEVYDLGSSFDTTLSRWTPPAGLISIEAQVTILGTLTAGQESLVAIYKNGAAFKAGNGIPFGVAARPSVSMKDKANGTDYYEVYAKAVGTGLSFSGGASATFFMGSR